MQITDINGRVRLHNKVEMPYLGLGVFQMRDDEEVINAINWALEAGYRHIDTAKIYYNEESVGKAVNESSIKREEIFVTSKVWNSDQGYENALRAYDESLSRLNFDYLDLYLIHWPGKYKFKETWKALEKLYNEKRVRAIGVSNFLQYHLEDLLSDCKIVPMVNQVEFHPLLRQQSLLDFCKKHSIQHEAWAPIIKGRVMDMDEFKELSKKYKKTPVQIVLRWDLQKGVVTIPKSVHKERIIANSQIFDFELSKEDMEYIDSLDRNHRNGLDPNTYF